MPKPQVADSSPASLLADLSKSFDQAPWAVTELSGDAHLVRYANPSFCRLVNKAPDQVIGVAFEGLLPPHGRVCETPQPRLPHRHSGKLHR